MILKSLPRKIYCGISFASDWYHFHAGSSYEKSIYTDPVLRHKQEVNERKTQILKYPQFYRKYHENVRPRIGIGVATIPKIWGCDVVYSRNMYPFAKSLLKPLDKVKNLKMPNLDDELQWLLEEIDILAEHGHAKMAINLPDLQGPLNIAMKLVGDNRLLALIARKKKADLVHETLEKSAEIYIRVNQILRKATNRPAKSPISISGCSYYYLRPEQITKFILPVVKKCEELGKRIRLHHCGEADETRIQALSKYPWSNIGLGFGSDLMSARKYFGKNHLLPFHMECRISPFRMLNQPAEQVRRDVQSIIDTAKGGSVSINVVGCPLNTPEENLWTMYNTIQDYNKSKNSLLRFGK